MPNSFDDKINKNKYKPRATNTAAAADAIIDVLNFLDVPSGI